VINGKSIVTKNS